MNRQYLLSSTEAVSLYAQIENCPIYDYHCHLSPKEIWEDEPFDNIGAMWLSGDHYKWRLMRAAGIPEEQITGNADWHTKFIAYAKAVSNAAGNPLYHWTQMELSRYFGIETPLSLETAEEIWQEAGRVIAQQRLSPRKLIQKSNVAYIATTDDVADSLEYHQKLRMDEKIAATVAPSFRADNVWLLEKADYGDYIKKLSNVSGVEIHNIETLKQALLVRLDYFVSLGCKFTDVGIPYFPEGPGTKDSAERAFQDALSGTKPSWADYSAFLWEMYVFIGGEYQKRNLVMQMHLAVMRNINTPLWKRCGNDCGGDCIGDPIPGSRIAALLNAIHQNSGLPQTILYTLNPSMLNQLCAIAGSFPNVRIGAAWWFLDHKRGIREAMEVIAETHHIGSFLGMLTDSRSFLSYARHDYFRRILCSLIADWVQSGEFRGDEQALAAAICYQNIQRIVEERNDATL